MKNNFLINNKKLIAIMIYSIFITMVYTILLEISKIFALLFVFLITFELSVLVILLFYKGE